MLEPFNYELCDDGNSLPGDGCNRTCGVEEGFACVVDESLAFPISRCKRCRNGKVEGAEQCDDGNAAPRDGCSPYCEIEDGWKCLPRRPDDLRGWFAGTDGGRKSVCRPDVCGDGNTWDAEECDDGNTLDNDGCSSKCLIEVGFKCNTTTEIRGGETFALSKCKNCGNHHIDLGEPCDDGNTVDGDGCSDGTYPEGAKWNCKIAVSDFSTGLVVEDA